MINPKDETEKIEFEDERKNLLPKEKGTGLYDLGEAIGGQSGGMIGDNNPEESLNSPLNNKASSEE